MEEINKIIKIVMKAPIDVLIIAILIFIGFGIFKKFFTKCICYYCCKIIKNTENTIDDKLFDSLERPLNFLITALGIYFSLGYVAYNIFGDELLAINNKIFKCIWVIFFTLIIYNVTAKKSFLYFRVKKKYTNKANEIIFPFIAIIIRILSIIVAISVLSTEFGFSGFITGLGISGVVIALATQDTFSNLFAGMVILFDRPFSIGDWIQTSDVEGIVKEITFRSTKIRSFTKALITIPNSKLANSYISNWTERKKRRISFRLPLDYCTKSCEIKSVVKGIEDLLMNDDRVDKELIIVSFDSFSDHSLDIFIYYYIIIMDYLGYKKTKEDINLSIMNILEDENVKLAVPRSKIYISSEAFVKQSEGNEWKE